MRIKDFFSFSKNRSFWFHIGAMILYVILVAWGTLKGLDFYTQHGEGVPVPTVKGMQLLEAESLLHGQNLELMVVDSCYVPEYAPGVIVEQNPVSGAQVKTERLIYVTVNSSTIPRKFIPDVIDNCSLREAQAKLGAAGFSLGENEYIEGERDWVYGVKYRGHSLSPRDKVPIGAILILVVGSDEFFMPETELDSLGRVSSDRKVEEEENEAEVDDSWF